MKAMLDLSREEWMTLGHAVAVFKAKRTKQMENRLRKGKVRNSEVAMELAVNDAVFDKVYTVLKRKGLLDEENS